MITREIYMPPGVDLFDARTINHQVGSPAAPDQRLARTIWGKPGLADRPEGRNLPTGRTENCGSRAHTINTTNARVNVLALAALNVWRRPLQEVLREEIMEPIGASSTWRLVWLRQFMGGDRRRKIQSVTGGGHWGEELLNAYDMARFGICS